MSKSVAQSRGALQSNLLIAINDSQTQKPFEKAQSVNGISGHSFSLDTVKKIFGNLKNGICERPGTSPDCTTLQGNVTSYGPNARLQ